MPSVEKRGNSWRLTAYLGYNEIGQQIREHKTISAYDISKTEAKRMSAIWEDQLKAANLRNTKGMTVSDFIAYWWENYGNTQSVTTRRRNKELFDRIEFMIGHIRIKKLNNVHIQKFIKQLQQPGIRKDKNSGTLSSRTIQMHYTLLCSVLNKAVKWRFIPNNPCNYVDRPAAIIKKTPIYQEQDLGIFLYHLLTDAPLLHRCFFLFAFTDGLRKSEVMGIDERHIDLENGTLDILETGVEGEDHKRTVYKPTTKTESSQTRMKIAPVTLEVTKMFLNERRNVEEALGLPHVTKLFTHPDGTPYCHNSFNKWLRNFANRYGLPHISIQSFRKMAVTYVLPAVNLKEASEFARHSNIQTTAKAYSEVLSSRREIPTMLLNNIVDDAMQSQGIKINIPTKNDKIIPINTPIAEKKSQKQAPKAK